MIWLRLREFCHFNSASDHLFPLFTIDLTSTKILICRARYCAAVLGWKIRYDNLQFQFHFLTTQSISFFGNHSSYNGLNAGGKFVKTPA